MKITVSDAAAAAIALLVAFTFGFSYGNVGNQATYLPHALQSLDSSFLSDDWFVHDTTPYHSRFQWVIWLANEVGSVGWVTATLNLALVAAGFYCVYRIAVVATGALALPTFGLVMLLVLMDQTRSVGGSYLFEHGLQPSALATLAWLAGVLFFLRGQTLASGVMLALGGAFHSNFLILGIGLFCLANVALGRAGLARRLALQMLPSLLVLAFDLPTILAAAGGGGSEAARTFFQQVRAPHHYLPSAFIFDFWSWVGWVLAGLSAAFLITEPKPVRAPLLALMGSMAFSVLVATLLTTVIFVSTISQIYVWRLAPFCAILSQIVVAAFALRVASGKVDLTERANLVALAPMAIGLLFVLRWYVSRNALLSRPTFILMGLGLLCAILWTIVRARPGRVAIAIPIISLVTSVSALSYVMQRAPAVIRHSTLLGSPADLWGSDLYAWARATPPGTVFLVPPEMEWFRVLGQRAVVVDWKSTPILPTELLAWHARLSRVAGHAVKDASGATNGYRAQSLAELRSTASHFGAEYVVVDRKAHVGDLVGEESVFLSGDTLVYETLPIGVGPAKGVGVQAEEVVQFEATNARSAR